MSQKSKSQLFDSQPFDSQPNQSPSGSRNKTARLAQLSLISVVAVGVLAACASTSPGVTTEPTVEAAQASNSACSETSPGVTLIVDFGKGSDLEPIQKCVSEFTGNGWTLFESAGVSAEGTAKYPTFACRISGYPSEENQDCGETASFDNGYWSYFFAEAEKADAWTMSPVGAADRKPACGSFEGWVYVAADDASAVPSVTAEPFVCATE